MRHDQAFLSQWKRKEMLAGEGRLAAVAASNERLKRYRHSNDPRATRGKAVGTLREKKEKQWGNTQILMTTTQICTELGALDWTQWSEWSEAALSRRVSLGPQMQGSTS